MLGAYRDLEENALIEKIRQYDSRAIEELYDRYSAFLFTIIYEITSDNQISEEILSDLFVIIWKRSGEIKTSDNLYAWLVTLARNLAVDQTKRQRGVDADTYTKEYESNFILPFIEENIEKLNIEDARQLKEPFSRAYGKLTDAQKFIIRLSYFEGLTINEISEKTKLPVETVRNKVNIAMERLVHNLNDERSGDAG